MSGGSGTRLWPASRSDRPKQFLQLIDERTMLRATLDRLAGLEAADPLVVANQSHADLVAAELAAAGFPADRMILEPLGRNTAPAAAVAALELTRTGDDPLILLLPADHIIEDVAAFGYGYIRSGAAIDDVAAVVAEFVEKPDEQTARAYVSAGNYSWNSGMFLFRCTDYLDALDEFAPEILSGCRRAVAAATRHQGLLLDAAAFSATPSDSIDYAVMEKTENAVVVPLAAGWNDVGSWAALWNISSHDEDGNVLVGDVVAIGTTDSYVRSQHRLVAVAGLDNVVVVETPDAVLVTTVENAQSVKNIVDTLKSRGRPEATRTASEED